MKLIHVALVLTLSLLGVTTWLAIKGHEDLQEERNLRALGEAQRGGGESGQGPLPPGIEARLTDMESKVADLESTKARLAEEKLLAESGVLPRNAASPAGLPSLGPPSAGGINTNLPPGPGESALVGTDAPLTDRITPEQKRILNAPVLGIVLEYNKEFAFVTVNAGSNKNVSQGDKYSIRRKQFKMADIVIDEVTPDQSVAAITPGSLPQGLEIQAGDEIIQLSPTF